MSNRVSGGSLKNSMMPTWAEFSADVTPLKLSGIGGAGSGQQRPGMRQPDRTSNTKQAVPLQIMDWLMTALEKPVVSMLKIQVQPDLRGNCYRPRDQRESK